MKRTTFVLLTALVLALVHCPGVDAQQVSTKPTATDVAANVPPKTSEPSDPTPPETLSGSAGIPAGVADTRGVQEAIDKYRLLFEGRNVDRLKQDIWPSMSPRQYTAVKNSFKVVSQVSLRESCPSQPVIASDSAEWVCNETLAYYVSGKPRPSQTHPIQFSLKKLDGKWYVNGRSGRVKSP